MDEMKKQPTQQEGQGEHREGGRRRRHGAFAADRVLRAGPGVGGLRLRSVLAAARGAAHLRLRRFQPGLGIRQVRARGVGGSGHALPRRLRLPHEVLRADSDPRHDGGRVRGMTRPAPPVRTDRGGRSRRCAARPRSTRSSGARCRSTSRRRCSSRPGRGTSRRASRTWKAVSTG